MLAEGQQVDEDIVCPLCDGILVKPRCCKHCELYYCSGCLEKAPGEVSCRCGKPLETNEPHKIINKILNSYTFRCRNHGKGCPAQEPYNLLSGHETRCQYVEAPCLHEFCDRKVLVKDREAHAAECPYRKTECEYCGGAFLFLDLAEHHNSCDKKPATCPGCQTQMYQAEFAQHQETCPEVTEPCPQCRALVRRREREGHTEVSCLYEGFLAYRGKTTEQIGELTKFIQHLNRRLNEQEAFFSTKCIACKRYACEVSRKNCEGCQKSFCIPCAKKSVRGCKQCGASTCQRCLEGRDSCAECQSKRRGQASVN